MSSKFELNTEPVESSSSEFEKIGNQVDSLSGQVSGYQSDHISYSCRFGYAPWTAEIDSAKGTISQNMETVSKRINNIAKALKAVVDNHSKLQATMQFTDLEARDNPRTDEEDEGHNHGVDGAGSVAAGAGAAGASGSGSSSKKSGKTTKEDKKGPVETELTDVGYVYPDKENLTEESKEIFNSASFRYDEDGYARLGDRFVVACDYSIGNIGDVLRFTQKTGEVIECVIGINTYSEKYKHTLNFIVDEQSLPVSPTKVTETILQNNLAIDNIGPVGEAGNYVYENPDGVLPANVVSGVKV